MLERERAVLVALAEVVEPFISTLTYREAQSIGVGSAQFYQIKRHEPVNFTALTIRRVAIAMGKTPSALWDLAERKSKRT